MAKTILYDINYSIQFSLFGAVCRFYDKFIIIEIILSMLRDGVLLVRLPKYFGMGDSGGYA